MFTLEMVALADLEELIFMILQLEKGV